jgi:hypothetical protein
VFLTACLQTLLLSAAAVLLFVYLHETAVSMAAARGRTLRGGFSWGITVHLALYVFVFLSLLQNTAALRWPTRRIGLAVLAWLIFAGLLTLLANPFASWAHPYRWALLIFCSAAGFALSLVGQSVWPLLQWRCFLARLRS